MKLIEIFGKVLKDYRLKAKMSQEELADLAGLHSTTISLYERGLRQPTLHTVFVLSRALEVYPSNFIEDLEELNPELS